MSNIRPELREVTNNGHSLKEVQNNTGYIFYHGTNEGTITYRGEPSRIEYAHRDPPPKGWRDKIRFCSEKRPSISVGRIIPGDMEHSLVWSPAGLLVADGTVVGTGSHITGPEGRMEPMGGESFPYSPYATPQDLGIIGHTVYELAVEKPEFSGIYFCPARRSTIGDIEGYENLEEKTMVLGRELGLPVFKIDDNGHKVLLTQP